MRVSSGWRKEKKRAFVKYKTQCLNEHINIERYSCVFLGLYIHVQREEGIYTLYRVNIIKEKRRAEV